MYAYSYIRIDRDIDKVMDQKDFVDRLDLVTLMRLDRLK